MLIFSATSLAYTKNLEQQLKPYDLIIDGIETAMLDIEKETYVSTEEYQKLVDMYGHGILLSTL